MRKQMIRSVSNVIEKYDDTCLFLVDIGVWGFREVLNKYPARAMNSGIFEDGLISVAAGMSLAGMTPFIYGISPFILGRAYEQLKLDFCYQKLAGNFFTTGAAYDFSKLGYSHYCMEDIELAQTLPGMEFIAPGTPSELEKLFNVTWNDGKPTYYRLSDHCNSNSVDVSFGKATVIKTGSQATVIAVSTMLDTVIDACKDIDVSIIYYTTLAPFDGETLRENSSSGKILLCEPHFKGALLPQICAALKDTPVKVDCLGVPREIIRSYGTKQEKDFAFNFTSDEIKLRLEKLMSTH